MNTDNQQEIGQVGWLAGIIDGEGTVSLTISRRANRSQMIRSTPKVLVANTDAGIIDRCIAVFAQIGVGNYAHHVRPLPRDLLGVPVKKFKPVTVLEVTGFKRVQKLLNAVRPFLAGDKANRADLLTKFIEGRIGYAAESKAAQNLAYRQEDVDNALAFLRVTRSKQVDNIAKILNEHTREARTKSPETRKKMSIAKARYWEQRRASRCALDSCESMRSEQK